MQGWALTLSPVAFCAILRVWLPLANSARTSAPRVLQVPISNYFRRRSH